MLDIGGEVGEIKELEEGRVLLHGMMMMMMMMEGKLLLLLLLLFVIYYENK